MVKKASKSNTYKFGNEEVKIYPKADGRWAILFREKGKWKNTTRAHEKDAREWARAKARELSSIGARKMVSPDESRLLDRLLDIGKTRSGSWEVLDDLQRAKEIVADDMVTLTALAKEWKARQKDSKVIEVTVSEAFSIFIDKIKVGDKTRASYRYQSGKFASDFDSMKIQNVSHDLIETWLDSHDDWSDVTWDNNRRNIVTFFKWCAKNGFLPRREMTEAEEISRPNLPDVVPPIVSPKQFVEVLQGIREDLVAYTAICGFAGLRPESEANRLEWKHIDLENEHIHVALEVSGKTLHERFVPIEPCLAAILSGRKGKGRVSPVKRGFDVLARDIKSKGIMDKWPRSVLRHSWISYRLARGDGAGRVAEHAGNSEQVTRKRYRRPVRDSVAEDWFSIEI